jgi:hypothetical protein
LNEAVKRASHKLARLTAIGLKLSQNDRRIILISQFIAALGPVASADVAARALLAQQKRLEAAAESSLDATDSIASAKTVATPSQPQQMSFSFGSSPKRS